MTGRQVICITSALAKLTTKLATCTHEDLNESHGGSFAKGESCEEAKMFYCVTWIPEVYSL